MRRLALTFLCLLGCSGDSDDDSTTTSIPMTPAPTMPSAPGDDTTTSPGPTTTSSSSSTSTDPTTSTTTPPEPQTTTTTTSTSTGEDLTTSDDTTGTPVDCNAPTTCTDCWNCARQGACKDPYEECAFNGGAFCVPSLYCVETMCTPDGVQPDCVANCCKSCTDLGTCNNVNAALSCILPMCSALCGQSTCGG